MRRDELAEAWQHLTRNEFSAAQRLAEMMLAKTPRDGRWLQVAGLVAHQQGNAVRSIELLQLAASELPDNADVHAQLGGVLGSAGRERDAESHLRRALELNPEHVDAQYNLGNICQTDGRSEEAVKLFGAAALRRPASVPVIFNWANALRDAGRTREAADAFERVIRLKPDYLKARNNLGNVYLRLGETARAIETLEKVIELRPDYAEAHVNLGNAFRAAGDKDKAIASYGRALAINNILPKAHVALADLLKDRNLVDDAAFHYRQAIAQFVPTRSSQTSPAIPQVSVAGTDMDLIRVWNNMGSCLVAQREFGEAEGCFRYVLSLDQKNAIAHNNLGVIRMSQGFLGDGRQEFEAAIAIDPRYAEAHSNLGAVLQNSGFNEEATAAYDKALSLDENLPDARWNRSLLWLSAEDWARGWQEYEWRWRRPDFCRQQFRCPPCVQVVRPIHGNARVPQQINLPIWDGRPLRGETVLLFAEQGLGDVIQFLGLVSMAKARGANIVVESPPRLGPLIRTCKGVDICVAQGEPLPVCDYQLPLMSLPFALGLNQTESLSQGGAYLSADPQLIRDWGRALEGVPGLKVGINWQGNPSYSMDRFRSVPLKEFAPLGQVQDVTLVSLQQGFGSEQTVDIEGEFEVHTLGHELDRDGAFLDTAAIMSNLDLMVTSDTAMAHLAGALGVATWVVLPAVADWRWGLSGERCPWYPNMRLFRQRRLGEWSEVFQQIAACVLQEVGNASKGKRS